jgi:hypothetical protein
MSSLSAELPLRGEPRDGASIRRKRKWLILRFVAQFFPDAVHEETICARLDMLTGLTHYRLKVYVAELHRGGYVFRNQAGMVKLSKPLDQLYKEIVQQDPEVELPS